MRRLAPTALLLVLAAATASLPAAAREVGGVDLPETAVAAAGATTLRLNGAGVRRRLFAAVYAVGLYLPTPTRDPARVLAVDGPRLVVVRFLYREVPREKLVAAWNEGFEANQDPAALRVLRLFDTLREGDRVELDFDPGRNATQVRINGQVRGEVAGADFAAALLRIWLGTSPVSDDLKSALLGP
jgi:hypothetical protein